MVEPEFRIALAEADGGGAHLELGEAERAQHGLIEPGGGGKIADRDGRTVLTFTYASLKDSDVSLMDVVDPELVTHIQSLTRDRIDPVAAEERDRAAQEGIAAWQRLLLGESLVYLDFDQRRLQVSHH